MTARAQNSVGHGRVETLVAAGVQRIYGGAGDSRNGITDAIRRRADIQ
jgi:pyruvate dehydrogenase (quinone)